MKHLEKFSYAAALFLLSVCLFPSCDAVAGMGSVIDLEPPAVSITSPVRFQYVPGEFEMKGAWTDNVKVVRVAVSDILSGREYGDAVINGSNWSLDIKISEEGEYGLKATAYDEGGNAGAGVVTVFVDQNPPTVSNAEIIRYQGLTPYATLKNLDELKALNPGSYEALDYFQNESFKIRTKIQDNRRVKDIKLKLYEYDESAGSLILLPITLSSISGNPLAPEWSITQDILTAARPELASGTHYLKAAMEVFDEAMNMNKKDNSLSFFCWKPDSDAPRISVNREIQGNVSVLQGDIIDFAVYDDDDLGLIYVNIFTPAEWAGIAGTTNEEKLAALQKGTADGSSDLNSPFFTAGNTRYRRETAYLSAPSVPGDYILAILAADREEGKTPPDGSVWFSRAITVRVEDPATQPPFPPIEEIICSEPDGTYSAGYTLTFKLIFQDKVFVQTGAEKTAFIEFSGDKFDDTKNKRIYVNKASEASSVLYFDYPVQPMETMYKIQVDSINLAGIVDRYGQIWDGSISHNFDRPNLAVDARPPKIIAFSPEADKVMDTASDRRKITLTFSEDVFAETGGLIQIRPYGDWYIPPLLTKDEFENLSQSTVLNDADKKILSDVDSSGFPQGNPIDNRRNYYTKTTWGLAVPGRDSDPVKPDLSTKYVLDFRLGLADDPVIPGDEIRPLRDVLNKAGWKRQTIDAADRRQVAINGNVVTITLPRQLEPGRRWELRIAPKSFRDAGGNVSVPLGWRADANGPLAGYYPDPADPGKKYAYYFWSSGTAVPVIRVKRISYNGGNPFVVASQPLPEVDVPVRIDCETPGAKITYAVVHKNVYNNGPAPGGFATSITVNKNYTIDDALKSELTGVSLDKLYTGPFYAGDKFGEPAAGSAAAKGAADFRLYTARKDYVAAAAVRTAGFAGPGLAASERSYEGVFKTVIMFKQPYRNSSVLSRLRLSGENRTLAGFPFPQTAIFDERYGKDMYRIQDDKNNHYLWLSWEIVDNWSHIKSYGYESDPARGEVIHEGRYGVGNFVSGYGMLAYRYAVMFWP